MPTTVYTIKTFERLVREMINDAVKEHMIKELDRLRLKELGGVKTTKGTDFTEPTTASSGTTNTSGTKPGIKTQPSNNDVAGNIMIPGSNMNINQGLVAAAKDPNMRKKASLIKKISDQVAQLKGIS